jgi:hypothetical protein
MLQNHIYLHLNYAHRSTATSACWWPLAFACGSVYGSSHASGEKACAVVRSKNKSFANPIAVSGYGSYASIAAM